MAKKVVRVDDAAEAIARELAAREGITLNAAVAQLIMRGHNSGGKGRETPAKSRRHGPLEGLDATSQARVRKWAGKKGWSPVTTLAWLIERADARQTTLELARAKKANGASRKKAKKGRKKKAKA